jgi:gamma-glutamyl hydrolase
MRACTLALLSLLSLSAVSSIPPQSNVAPTIGILSVPLSGAGAPCITATATAPANASCFTTFYAKWVETQGARVVILPYDEPATLAALLDSVNGVLLTGGELEDLGFDTPYMVAAAQVLAAALAKNDAGVYFPLHGTCQGMQVLSLLVAQDASVMAYNAFDAENESLALDITWDGHHSSRIFSVVTAPADIVATLSSTPSTVNLHHDGVPVSRFAASERLGAFFILVSTNFDRKGAAFVSTLEAWKYPITATQWHPERPQFEWRDEGIAHDEGTIRAMQYMSNYLVSAARRNQQSFTDDALFARFSAYSYPIVSAPDAAFSACPSFFTPPSHAPHMHRTRPSPPPPTPIAPPPLRIAGGYQWLVFTG